MFYKFKLKTNKSALYRININDVALVLGTYSQTARDRLLRTKLNIHGFALKSLLYIFIIKNVSEIEIHNKNIYGEM